MKARNILYGYCYEGGKIVRCIEETKIVEEMSQAYLNGQSLLEIAENLNRRGIEYMPGLVGWNKSRIMRLLEDKRYLGTELFPAIMRQETYDAIQEIRDSKSTQRDVDRKADIFQINVPICCPNCGMELRRKKDRRRSIPTKWICKNEQCGAFIKKADETLVDEITALMNGLIDNPEQIILPIDGGEAETDKLRGLKGEITRLLQSPKIDRETARTKMLAYAEKQYAEIDPIPSQSQRLKDIFINWEQTKAFSSELLSITVDEVKLYMDGTIGLVLENKQEIRGGGTYGTR